jgi:hypothetical protein
LLVGERLHQWIGARHAAEGRRPRPPDLDRIARQQVLVRRGAVTRSSRLDTFARVRAAEVDGKRVLVAKHPTLFAQLASAIARVGP